MKKRLVIAGLPCPSDSWEKLLGKSDRQRIITMHEVLAGTNSSDPRELSRYITDELERERPTSLICHDLGVPLTLLALLRLKRRGTPLDMKLTIFNGAFRNVSLWRARQPLRMQWTPVRRVIREVERRGGQIDPRLMEYLPRIRAVYRMLILHRLADKMTSMIGFDYLGRFPKRAGLRIPTQIIASSNDPYLPYESMEQLREDLEPDRFVEMEYGHFPYSISGDRIRSLIETFEN